MLRHQAQLTFLPLDQLNARRQGHYSDFCSTWLLSPILLKNRC